MQSWQDMTANPEVPERTNGSATGAGLSRDIELMRSLATDEALASGGLTVTRIAEITGRDTSQVSRAMRALESAALVERDADRRYRTGPAVFELAASGRDDHLFRRGVITLETLAEQMGAAVHLCILVGTDVRTLATRTPDNLVVRVIGWEDRLVPAHSTSAGLALLGDFTAAQLEARFSDVAFHLDQRSKVADVDALWAEVRRAIATGYALTDTEVTDGWVGASAPVRDHTQRIVAAINVSIQKSDWHQDLATMGSLVLGSATELSQSLGCSAPSPLVSLRPV